MENESQEFRKINERTAELKHWIFNNAPQCITEEKHLIEGSEERGYWALGYMTALFDVLRLFSRGTVSQNFGNKEARTRRAA